MTIRSPGDEVYSNSEVQTWLRCQRKWWFSHYRKVGIKERSATGPRELGTRCHFALASMYQPEPQDPMVALEKTILDDLSVYPEQAVEIEKEADLARAMIEGYVQWTYDTGVDIGLRVIAPELRVEVLSGLPGVKLIEKLDVRLVRESDNIQLFMDHKTVGNLTEPVRTLHMNPQMLHYHLIEYLEYLDIKAKAELEGKPPPGERHTDGALYNMIRKVKRTATAKPPFYERVEVRHNIHELRNYWKRVHSIIQRIREAQQALDAGGDHQVIVPPRPISDCHWDCDYFVACPLFDDGSNAEGLLEQYYVPTDPIARYLEQPTGQES